MLEVEKELGVELILDEADQASKVRRSISENDSVTVAQKECFGGESEEMLLFQELDKGINDMETDRVIEHDEAMRTFKGKIK